MLTIGHYPATADVCKMEDLAEWHGPGLTLCLQGWDVQSSESAVKSM